jgi:regulator of cell morphogenesis and NO signaling
MSNRATAAFIDTDTTVNDVIRTYPNSVSVFNELGIDACCGGDASLTEAARRDGVDLGTLVARLDAIAASSARAS